MKVKINGLGTIEADEDCLNEICIAFQYSRDWHCLNGAIGFSSRHDAIAKAIFNQLDACGYYDDSKKRLGFE